MLKKSFRFILFFIISLFVFSTILVSADEVKNGIPYSSYTYWYGRSSEEKTAVYSKPIYEVLNVFDFNELGLSENFVKITDVCTSKDGDIYILDSDAPKVVVLDSKYKVKFIIDSINSGDNVFNFKRARGIFVDKDNFIYIADTENARILKLDDKGSFISEIMLPDSRLIPESFSYKPLKLTVDSKGYMYVLSDGSYNGAILYSPEGEFLGFYGANSVKQGVAETLVSLWKKLTLSNERRASLEKTLPYQFTDLCIDKSDFIYTTTGNVAKSSMEKQTGQIRKLSPGGSNVEKSDGVNFGDEGYGPYAQDILGITVDDRGFVYALDSAYGHIFVYSPDFSLMGVFGCGTRTGVQDGSFSNACAIDVNGKNIIVVDSKLNTITVFAETSYGKKLKEAQLVTISGDYDLAKPLWEELLKEDKNNQLSYIGLAKALNEEGDYEKAMEYAKIGCDRDTYALAFEHVRNNFLEKNLAVILLTVFVITLLFVVVLRYNRKKGIVLLTEKWRLVFTVMRHPNDAFYKIKHNKKGSYLIAIVILLIFYVTSVLKTTAGGFCHVVFDAETYNALLILLRTVGFVILFTCCYWAISTLMHGLGKLGEIFIIVCYSFTPIIISNLISIVLTNIMIPSEIEFLNFIITVMMLYTALLLFIGLMRISDYEFGRLIIVLLLTFAAMVIVVFVLIVLFLLGQLFFGFFNTVISEIYKMIVFGG